MIESRLDPVANGIGRGFNGDPTLADVAEKYRYLVEEAKWRSVTATLRFFAEERSIRFNRLAEPGCLVVSTLLLYPTYLFCQNLRHWYHTQVGLLGAAGAIYVIVAAKILSSPGSRKGLKAQLAELDRMTLKTLAEIVDRMTDPPQTFTKEQRQAFASLRHVDRDEWDRIAVRMVSPR